MDNCSEEDRKKWPDDCVYEKGNDILKDRFQIDIKKDPNVTRDSFLVLFAMMIIYRMLAFTRMYIRYVWDDNLVLICNRRKTEMSKAD